MLESLYEWGMTVEMDLRKLSFEKQRLILIKYKGRERQEPLRFDLLVESCLLVEIKAVEQILPIHKAQLLSYMKLLDVPLGLLINFNECRVTDGMCRLILPGANLKMLSLL